MSEPPAPSTSTDPGTLPPPSTLGETFRHSGWQPMRRTIYAALVRTHQPAARVGAFAACGCSSWVQQHDDCPAAYRITCNHCRDRLCTPCANARAARLRDALYTLVAGRPHTFITLTLCGKGESLGDLVDRLYKHFRALRSHPLWEESVKGGAAFLEIKWSDKASRWHPHLHIIADAGFIPQGELSTAWRSITRDSYIVDVRRVRGDSAQLSYVTKYASKPLNSSFANTPVLLDEAINSLKGRRLCLCFGTWYGTPLNDVETEDLGDDLDAKGWHNVGPLDEIWQRHVDGDGDATAILVGTGRFDALYAAVLSDDG